MGARSQCSLELKREAVQLLGGNIGDVLLYHLKQWEGKRHARKERRGRILPCASLVQ